MYKVVGSVYLMLIYGRALRLNLEDSLLYLLGI